MDPNNNDQFQATQEILDEVNKLNSDLTAAGTKKNTMWGKVLWDNYQKTMKNDVIDLVTSPKDLIDKRLSCFFFKITKKDKKQYSPQSLRGIRAALNRHIKLNGGKHDIINDPEFRGANLAYDTALKRYVNSDEAVPVKSRSAISEEDLKKIGNFIKKEGVMTPWNHMCSAWFLLAYLCGERGVQLWRQLKVSDVVFSTDDSGKDFLTLHSGRLVVSKNYQMGAPQQCKIYKQQDGDLCTYNIIKSYINRFGDLENTGDVFLFCHPLRNPTEDKWYSHRPLGRNSLADLMPKICNAAGLSRRYTNHQVGRNTTTTVLMGKGYAAEDVQYLTRHRNTETLKVYKDKMLKEVTIPKLHNTLYRAISGNNHQNPVSIILKFRDKNSLKQLT